MKSPVEIEFAQQGDVPPALLRQGQIVDDPPHPGMTADALVAAVRAA